MNGKNKSKAKMRTLIFWSKGKTRYQVKQLYKKFIKDFYSYAKNVLKTSK